ncbi:hypothetical protein DM02DRAFT_655624 [Periconia macrospinosa]|uniref:Uncharacterized protein n=1 Tax=Periconia macrospinosa TaxID=97972 RepID=A0A2V1DQ49_9PLEO|nr:hypothetical protein DM02DRAFT_655624 [Periconia macrospinosa]
MPNDKKRPAPAPVAPRSQEESEPPPRKKSRGKQPTPVSFQLYDRMHTALNSYPKGEAIRQFNLELSFCSLNLVEQPEKMTGEEFLEIAVERCNLAKEWLKQTHFASEVVELVYNTYLLWEVEALWLYPILREHYQLDRSEDGADITEKLRQLLPQAAFAPNPSAPDGLNTSMNGKGDIKLEEVEEDQIGPVDDEDLDIDLDALVKEADDMHDGLVSISTDALTISPSPAEALKASVAALQASTAALKALTATVKASKAAVEASATAVKASAAFMNASAIGINPSSAAAPRKERHH